MRIYAMFAGNNGGVEGLEICHASEELIKIYQLGYFCCAGLSPSGCGHLLQNEIGEHLASLLH